MQGSFDPSSEEYKLGQNIRKYRLKCSMSQMDLAAAVDIDRTAVSRYENGVGGEMGFKLLRRIACVLNTSVDKLLDNYSEFEPNYKSLDNEKQKKIAEMAKALYNLANND